MDYITGIQKALDYIEEHLTEAIDFEAVAAVGCFSSYHFQRLFSLLSGYTLGEYIRMRRLTLAGQELSEGSRKVIDVALKYGYETPESFSKAFTKFHGVSPSEARKKGTALRSFSKLSIKVTLEGGSFMNYMIEEKKQLILTGYKKHFTGSPYGAERFEQEEEMFVTTRGKQWVLRGASDPYNPGEHCVVTNVTDEGYDFYLCYDLTSWERQHLYDHSVTGVDFIESLGFENLVIPAGKYLVVRAEQEGSKSVNTVYEELRKRIPTELGAEPGLHFKDGPELAVYKWLPKETRNIEIWLPVE